MPEILKNMSMDMADKFDTNLAKAFLTQAGNNLLDNGIKIFYRHTEIKSETVETPTGIIYKKLYGIYFDGLDTSEHDSSVITNTKRDILALCKEAYSLQEVIDFLENDLKGK